ALLELQVTTANMRIATGRLLTVDASQVAAVKQEADNLFEKLNTSRANYGDHLVTSAEERSLWSDYDRKMTDYLAVRSKVLAAYASHDVGTATRIQAEEAQKPFEVAAAALDRVIKLNVAHASTYTEEAKKLVAETRRMLVAIVVAMLLFGVFAAVYV